MKTALRFFSLLLLSFFLTSCGKTTPESLRADATLARDDAKSAYESKQPKKAIKAADRAEDLSKKAKKLADSGQLSDDDKQKLPGEIATLAREARHYARLADQEDQLRRRLGSLKLRAYSGARSFAVTTIFKYRPEIFHLPRQPPAVARWFTRLD
jgi:predicted small lipoprotein YifL